MSRAQLDDHKNAFSLFSRQLLQIDIMGAKCIRNGTDNLANSIESLIALYAHRQSSMAKRSNRGWDPRNGSLAEDIDQALRDATKSYNFPEQLWMNLKAIIVERLTRKVHIDRPGVRRERVRDWVSLEDSLSSFDQIKSTKEYEDILNNLSESCKSRI